MIGRPHDASDQETAGAEPTGQAERVALREIVGIGSGGSPPRDHDRARIGRPRPALAGQPGCNQIDHPFAQIAQGRSRAGDPERSHRHEVRIERCFRMRPAEVPHQQGEAERAGCDHHHHPAPAA